MLLTLAVAPRELALPTSHTTLFSSRSTTRRAVASSGGDGYLIRNIAVPSGATTLRLASHDAFFPAAAPGENGNMTQLPFSRTGPVTRRMHKPYALGSYALLRRERHR